MLVTPQTFDETVEYIKTFPIVCLDTETTGLSPYGTSRLFSVIVAVPSNPYTAYYFDYNEYFLEKNILDRGTIPRILDGYRGVVCMHNAPFDMAMMEKEGADISTWKINCTVAMGRVNDSRDEWLTLDNLTKDLGFSKIDTVKQYIMKNKLWDWEQVPGKKTRSKNLYYYKVPLHVVQPYGEMDTLAGLTLGFHQAQNIDKQCENIPEGQPSIKDVVTNERKITRVVFDMKKKGICIDTDFIVRALEHEGKNYKLLTDKFEQITGYRFLDSNVLFSMAFDKLGVTYPRTEKGNPSFNEKALEGIDNPLANLIKECRGTYKRMGTYEGLLYHSHDGVIHANVKQHGCVTGRMSYADPPVQCMEKVEKGDANYEDEFLIRRSFVPRKGTRFFMLDFDQMEYRMMLNYAGQRDLIDMVRGGMDVHQATADMLGITRSQAKTINFALLYGMGKDELAKALKTTVAQSSALKEKYFSRLPRIKTLIQHVISAAQSRGVITNWFGRRYYFERDWAYKAPNYLIQGGCADWMKCAMVQIHEYLKDKPINMLLQVHDELIFEGPPEAEDEIEKIRHIMENVTDKSPHTFVKYTVGVDYSDKSWQDKEPWNE